MSHDKHARVGHVIRINEFAPRFAGSPKDHFPLAFSPRLANAVYQGTNDMAVVRAEIIAGPERIDRDGGKIAVTKLPPTSRTTCNGRQSRGLLSSTRFFQSASHK